ncbi:sorbitol dehydrogenase family protein [Halomonas sp. 707D7]|uniref:sorbitol dehydrogenase family protein n=2 Tax=unclassified Halomonas TaxID=2609666 RepID=UPI0020A12B66|nr:sorbitol dehydrogenase family protein [Halomonas sp. 707D7]MCP1315840.1 sorbitol dehydrogenase family protein [Halomonas sp. 707D7]
MATLSRRRVIQLAGGFALTGVAGRWLTLPEAWAEPVGAPADELSDFLEVSRKLTQRDELDEHLAGALVLASTLALEGFGERLARLKALLDERPALLERSPLDFGDDFTDQETTARQVLGGWYTGVVGSGDQAIYVTYLNALANRVVADKLVPPSFSYGPCGSWRHAP